MLNEYTKAFVMLYVLSTANIY